MNTKKMIAVMAVLAMAVAAFAFAPVGGISGDDEKYVEMKGDFTSTLTMTSEQTVVVVDDLNIIAGGQLTILGDFIVKEGKTVTIEGYDNSTEGQKVKYSKLMLYGNATIDGNIVSKVEGGLEIEPGSHGAPAGDYKVTINGTVTALGDTSGTPVETAVFTAAPAATDSKDIIVNGAVVIGTNAKTQFTKVVFEKNATLTVLGVAKGDISVYGTVNFDGATTTKPNSSTLTISIAEASAVINIVSVEGTIIVTDAKMFAYAYGGAQYYVDLTTETALEKKAVAEITESGDNTPVAANTMSFANVKNIKITETVTTSIEYDEKASANVMIAATAMNFAPLDSVNAVEGLSDKAAISVTAGKTVYFQTMVIEDVTVTIGASAIATIVGDVTYPLQDVWSTGTIDRFTFTVAGELDVLGSLAILKMQNAVNPLPGTADGKVVAAWYHVKDADNFVNHYYTTLQKAIDNGATSITMMGQLIVEKDLTVPAGVSLTTADIGYSPAPSTPLTVEDTYSVIVRDGATFAIANGAKFTLTYSTDANAMLIEGTFVIENIDYGITLNLGASKNKIFADVQLKDGSYEMYTDIYNAFAKAKAGDEIKAYNPAYVPSVSKVHGTIVIDKDLTLPANVKFDSNGKFILVENGAVFTVAGNLYIIAADYLCSGTNGWNDKTPAVDSATGAVKDYSVIVIGADGVITFKAKSLPAIADAEKDAIINGSTGYYDKFKIAGAYFLNDVTDVKDAEYYIANIPLAFSGILDAKFDTVYVLGEVTIDNVKVTGTEKERAIVNIGGAKTVTMKGFTFAYATVNVVAGVTLTGDIGTATGKMIFDETRAGSTEAVAFTEEFLDDAMNFVVAGQFNSNNSTSVYGTVYFKSVDYRSTTELTADADYSKNRLTVASGAKLFIIGFVSVSYTEVVVEGALTVTGYEYSVGKYARIAGASGTNSIMSVLGTLTVEKIDGKAGTLGFLNIAIGGTSDMWGEFDDVRGTALVAGEGTFVGLDRLHVYVLNGSSITAPVLKDWMAADDTKKTEFYLDGTLWITAYGGKNTSVLINDVVPAHSDYKITGWEDKDGNAIAADKKIGSIDKVYGIIEKNIYNIVVTADVGIDNIYIDGVIMTKITANNTFEQTVTAGTHTISYELANGYSGNAVITTIDGKALVGGGLSFVINDDKYDDSKDKMDITLSGIVKSGYDVDPETHEEKSTGLTVTEILLIVVVIIMAIMAVVLILRLNRS